MAIFLSRESVYQGDYTFFKRSPDSEFNPNLHYHDFYEVQIYTAGKGLLKIGECEYTVSCGDIALINLFEPHQFGLSSAMPHIRYCISLDSNFLISMCSENSNLLSIFNGNNHNYPVIHLDGTDFSKYVQILSRFEQIKLIHGRDIMERSLLFELLANLYNDYYDGTGQNPTDANHITTITKLVRFVNDHIAENLSLEVLADVVNFSTFYMCRMFKKYTGYTVNQYIMTKRIEKAKSLLTGNLPISAICIQAGFHNYSCFYKAFINSSGISPSEYRLKNAGKIL